MTVVAVQCRRNDSGAFEEMTVRFCVLVGTFLAAIPLLADSCDLGTAGLDQLLNEVLPLNTRPLWATGERKVTTVRFTPLESPPGEMSVMFVEDDHGAISAQIRSLPQRLSVLVEAVVERESDLSCSEVLQRLTIRKSQAEGIELKRLRRLYLQLRATKINTDAASEIYLDTDKYELYISGGMADIEVTLFPGTRAGGRRHPILQPLDEIRRVAGDATRTTAQ